MLSRRWLGFLMPSAPTPDVAVTCFSGQSGEDCGLVDGASRDPGIGMSGVVQESFQAGHPGLTGTEVAWGGQTVVPSVSLQGRAALYCQKIPNPEERGSPVSGDP